MRPYVSKAEFLIYVDKHQPLTQVEIETQFSMTANGAKAKIYRMCRLGFLEATGIESGTWVLSPKGVEYVEHLKQQMKERSKNGNAD